jgi:hypothetical protein
MTATVGLKLRNDPSPAEAAAAEAEFHKFAVEVWTLLSVAVVVTVFRTYVRVTAVGWRKLCWDDYLVWVGVVRQLRAPFGRLLWSCIANVLG